MYFLREVEGGHHHAQCSSTCPALQPRQKKENKSKIGKSNQVIENVNMNKNQEL